MAVFFGRREKRDAFPYPFIPSNADSGSVSIRRVNLTRADGALQKVAIFASVNLLASITSMLPFNVFSGTGSNKRARPIPSWMADIGGQGHGTSDFLWQVVYCWGLRGNVVGRVVDRNPINGQPIVIDLAHPDDVSNTQDPSDPSVTTWRIHGKEVPNKDIWHRRVYPTPGTTLGLSPIALHAVTIGQGLYAQNFGAQWFLDGAHPSAILSNEGAQTSDQTTAKTVKDRFLAAVRGTREPVVLGGGWKYQQIQIAPGESQFLETQRYTAADPLLAALRTRLDEETALRARKGSHRHDSPAPDV